MSRTVFFLDNLSHGPHSSLTVKKSSQQDTWPVDNMLGHFFGFPFDDVYNVKHLSLFKKEDKKYLISFIHMPVVSAPYLSNEAIQALQSDDNFYLVLFSVHEYVITPKDLARNLQKRSIPHNKVVVLCSNLEADNKVLEGVKYLAINFWESYSRVHLKTLPGSTIVSAQVRLDTLDSAKKKFLSLNRNIKPHRIWWYYAVLKTEMVNQSHISFHLPSVNKAEFDGLCKKDWVLKRIPTDLHKDFEKYAVRRMFTKKLDQLSNNYLINYNDSIKSFYLDSVLSVVTESESTKNFITEKTYKAIVNLHPFFIIGNPDQHVLLRARGYHTFEDLFGVDQVMDYSHAVQILENIKAMDLTKLKDDIREKYFDKLLHNQQLFLNRRNNWQTIETAIFKALGTETF